MLTSAILLPVIQSVIFLTASGLVFAALLVLAEKKILNYGSCVIDVNNGKKRLAVQGGNTLLSSLVEQGIFIPSACGGRGSCAYCKVSVVNGGGAIGPVEEPYLSDQERAGGVRLSCQVKVRNDLAILIPDELFSIRKFTGRVVHKKSLTHDIVELRIELLDPPRIDFVAGQYVQLQSEMYRSREEVMRAYSISSVPSDNHYVELVIRLVPEGICTTWVFEFLKEGQQVFLSGPYGTFRLSSTNAPVIFIAGGSGMAPIWSMVRSMKEGKIARESVFFFGARTEEDLFYVNELRAIEKECSWFKFVPSLSGAAPADSWTGERGLVTEVVARHFPDTSRHEAYLCGSPGMIDACIKVLTAGGMPMEKVFYDKF